VSENLIKKFF